MSRTTEIELEFEIDKLTNSIENTISGEVFQTEIVLLSMHEKKQIKKLDWQFDWISELKDTHKKVFKLNYKII